MSFFNFKEYEKEVFSKNKKIASCCEFSNSKLSLIKKDIRNSLKEKNYKGSDIVAVFGSYAREEASTFSDLDYLIISECDDDYNTISDVIKCVCTKYEISSPNQDGVFNAMEKKENIVGSIGSKVDNYETLSRRMLFLLESKSLYNEEEHLQFVNEILSNYTQEIDHDVTKNYVHLLNDLIRYFRTICVNYAYTKDVDKFKWSMRNIKLRHSRVIMYASLLCVLGTLSKYAKEDKNEILKKLVLLTPLQRFYFSYKHSEDDNFFRLSSIYNNFLYFINNKEHREELFNIDYRNRYDNETFSILKANSDSLLSEITRFIFSNKGTWSDRFFEYLML